MSKDGETLRPSIESHQSGLDGYLDNAVKTVDGYVGSGIMNNAMSSAIMSDMDSAPKFEESNNASGENVVLEPMGSEQVRGPLAIYTPQLLLSVGVSAFNNTISEMQYK